MDAIVDDLMSEGRAALKRGDADAARGAFTDALETGSRAAALEGLAGAFYLGQDSLKAIDRYEQAFAGYRTIGDGAGAVRTARTLGCLYGTVVGDWAIAGGWIARAQHLLDDVDDPREQGWVALSQGMFEANRALKEQRFGMALERGRATNDADLTFATLAYYGASLVHGDRVEEGMLLLDEALAAVAGGEVEDWFVVEEIFCQLFSACERAQDVDRAEQWIRVGETLAVRRNLPAVAAYCHTHFGGVLIAAGRWAEAEAALTEAVRLWTVGRRTLKSGAIARLADLRVRQGRLEEAEQLLSNLPVDDDTVRPLTALHLAKGETGRAREILEHALRGADPASTNTVPLLALLVDLNLADDRLSDAAAAAEAMGACADAHPSGHLEAMVALARGRVALATGTGDAEGFLRDAIEGFGRALLPLESARSHLELAAASVKDRPEVAIREARAALSGFEQLRAARYFDAASALLRSLGVRVPTTRGDDADGLTRREVEILELLGRGLSNPEIAERLFISRKTVEHHVGNVLSKLGLRTRAEAAAYVVRRKPGPE
ncbi:MAG: hypothetical protein JWR35_119 [Marmoricola sp.]|nr:hypothetical protein [Marmoricola sp.]